ncbi:MAG: DUF1446 domain-containing protein, partial [Myxococcales bacterium]|nr:DUF1446 domain-containing protein [Myxococcales bacterium]
MADPTKPFRIANCSGFYGDRVTAAREMVEGGPIDVLTGDYLAELTMLILFRTRMKDPKLGYAKTFIAQMEEVLGTCLDRGIKVVTNAGGLNPAGMAERMAEVNQKLGLHAKIAYIEGDDVMRRLGELREKGHPLANLDTGEPFSAIKGPALTANVYLGAWGIVDALSAGADVVICPRVTDASVVVGPAAWRFGWKRTDWDRLAGAVVAGHIIECGTQTTGGNFSFFTEVPSLNAPGFPIAEVHEDGSSVITKHPGTDGLVSVETVTTQLLYESGGVRYLNPDVVARFDTIELAQEAPDRVRVSGVRGEPAPATLKLGVNYLAGHRRTIGVTLTGLRIEEKARVFEEALFARLGDRESFDEADVRLIRSDKPDAPTNEEASATLRITLKDQDPNRVGRFFFDQVVAIALANYPGFYMANIPGEANPCAVFWPALVPASEIEHVVVLPDGTRKVVPHTAAEGEKVEIPEAKAPPAPSLTGPTRRVPLGTLFGAASGDKGGNANLGLYARSDAAYAWLADFMTVERLKTLLTEAKDLKVERTALPKIRALNFMLYGLLGTGVASSVRTDAQAKSLGEYARSRFV